MSWYWIFMKNPLFLEANAYCDSPKSVWIVFVATIGISMWKIWICDVNIMVGNVARAEHVLMLQPTIKFAT